MWPYSKEYVEARVEHLSSLYSRIDADILFIQEIASEDVIRRIIKKTGKDYSFFMATPEKSGVGNAVLYKSKDCVCESIPATSSFPVFTEGDADTIGPRIWSRRDFVKITTDYKGKKLQMFGLHLKSRFFMRLKNKDKIDYPINSQIEAADALIRSDMFTFTQARKMREAIDEVFANNIAAQVLVAGDFNSSERDIPFRIIQGDMKDADDSLLTTIDQVPAEKRYSFVADSGKKLIDHILVSKNLRPHVISTNIINENLKHQVETAPIPSFIESDHAPLVIELD